MDTDLASQAAKAGITIGLQHSNFSFIITNYNNQVPADQAYANKWAMIDFGGERQLDLPDPARRLQHHRRLELRQLP